MAGLVFGSIWFTLKTEIRMLRLISIFSWPKVMWISLFLFFSFSFAPPPPHSGQVKCYYYIFFLFCIFIYTLPTSTPPYHSLIILKYVVVFSVYLTAITFSHNIGYYKWAQVLSLVDTRHTHTWAPLEYVTCEWVSAHVWCLSKSRTFNNRIVGIVDFAFVFFVILVFSFNVIISWSKWFW